MATLKEIYDFVGSADSSDLRNKIVAALVVRSMAIVNDGTSTAEQNNFARACLRNPKQYEATALNAIMGEYHLLTLAQIQAVGADPTGDSDTDIQAAVNKVVDQLLGVA